MLGFLVYRKTYKVGILKMKKRLRFAKGVEQQNFFFGRLFLFNEESKLLLEKHGKSLARQVDGILSKLRLNCPKENLSLKEQKFFYEVLKEKPVYIVKSDRDFFAVELALKFEDFYAVFFSNKEKKENNLFDNKINLVNLKNKRLCSVLEKLNVNFLLPSNLNTFFKAEQFSFKKEFKKSSILTQGYLLEKYQNGKIDFFVYRLFVGECLSFVIVKNKGEQDFVFEFEYFYDFANEKINYFEFEKKHNFILIKNLKRDTRTYFNFSCPTYKVKTSALIEAEKSNLPCLHLNYSLNLQAKSTKQLAFMFSKSIQPLPLLDLKKLLIESSKQLEEFFFFDIDFLSDSESKFFSKLISQAKITFLQSGETSFIWHKGDYVLLKQKYLNKEIDAFCFYLSVQKSLINVTKNEVVVNPHFLKSDFVVNFKKDFKPIYISKQNLKVPYLILDGVKYYNHFAIPIEFLKNKPAKIQL